jgi:hypothetical protein
VTSLARRPLFWVAYVVVALLALALAVRLFPQAIPIVNLDVKLGRDDALTKALQVAVERKLAPSDPRTAARFNHDGIAQNYVELEGGGKPAFAALTRGALYSPYWWEVRVFSPGVIDESTIRFRPDGTLYGFTRRVAEAYVRNAATKALPPDAARALAESRAQAEWGIALAPYALIEQSQSMQDNGRVDHSFVYERPEHIGEATVRLRLVVAGDELIGVMPFMKIPERFNRRFEELRSTNNLIAGVAGIVALLIYGVGGVLLGSLWLARRHWLVWRPALVAGLCVGALLAARCWQRRRRAGSASTPRRTSSRTGASGSGVPCWSSCWAASRSARCSWPPKASRGARSRTIHSCGARGRASPAPRARSSAARSAAICSSPSSSGWWPRSITRPIAGSAGGSPRKCSPIPTCSARRFPRSRRSPIRCRRASSRNARFAPSRWRSAH